MTVINKEKEALLTMHKITNTLLLFVMMISVAACNPFKVTDPNDPDFDPMKFSFHDYHGPETIDIYDVFRVIFPVGTDREFVEKVLIDSGKATLRDPGGQVVWYYPPEKWKGKGTRGYAVIFDHNKKLLNIESSSKYEPLYPDQITKWDLLSPEDREIHEKLNHIKRK